MNVIGPFTGEYRWLSNFWYVTVHYHGVEFPAVENAYQAAKLPPELFTTARVHEYMTCTPGQAKRWARQQPIRSNWDDIRLDVMRGLLEQKFQNPELRDKLIATGTTPIVELNTWGDRFWGVDGAGHNHLGCILMDIRTRLITGDPTDARISAGSKAG